jgi:hypothetical protein
MAQYLNTDSSVVETANFLATQYPRMSSAEQLLRLKATLLHVSVQTHIWLHVTIGASNGLSALTKSYEYL